MFWKLFGDMGTDWIYKEFRTARRKLTGVYVCCVFLIGVIFSVVLWYIVSHQYHQHTHIISESLWEDSHQTQDFDVSSIRSLYSDAFMSDVMMTLVWFNILMLILSWWGWYMLAGITLRPLREKLNEETSFLSDAAHEMRNPLSAIKLVCQSEIKEHNDESFVSILEEIERLIHLSEWVLELSKPQIHMHTTMHIDKVLQRAVSRIKPLLHQKDIHIEAYICHYRWLWNEESLEKIFYELLYNAYQFSHQGGKIIISLDTSWKFFIQDFWIGIQKHQIKHIFKRFYKADSSRNFVAINGAWLGLSLVEKYLHDMGYAMTVISQYEIRTRFDINFSKK